MKRLHILMIDDDPVFIESYVSLLADEFYVHGAPDIPTGFKLIEKWKPFALLLDITLKTEKEGLKIIPQIKKKFPNLHVVVVTNWDSHLIYNDAMTLGADAFFVKSDNVNHLKVILYDLIAKKKTSLQEKENFPIACSEAFKHVLNEARKAARHDCPVLICGETGVGKEVVAQFIHQQSRRRKGPFIPINCGSIPDTLIESEFFGFEKGAFTGAFQRKSGKFELANGGTLFLDEVSELSKHAQVALLRFIQTQEIEHLGGTKNIQIDVRLIVASQKDLNELKTNGSFREDLYHRLAVFPIFIPPLREREEDIIPLCHYFLNQFLKENNIKKKNFTQSALIMLKNYHWPGNIRELRNVIERAVIKSDGAEIRPGDLMLQMPPDEYLELSYDSAKADVTQTFQRNFIKAALCRNKGNITQTAKKIGISRQALIKILKDLNLDIKKDK